MKKDTMLLVGAALLLFLYCRKKKQSIVTPTPVNATTNEQLQQVVATKDPTVNFVQQVPSPAMIIDLPAPISEQQYKGSNRCCTNQSTIGSLPFIC